MNRVRTDFLLPASSFLTGYGSIINLSGRNYKYNTSENPDQIALSLDWYMVGQDIQDTLKKIEAEVVSAAYR